MLTCVRYSSKPLHPPSPPPQLLRRPTDKRRFADADANQRPFRGTFHPRPAAEAWLVFTPRPASPDVCGGGVRVVALLGENLDFFFPLSLGLPVSGPAVVIG